MLIARLDSTTDSLVFISSTAVLFASWPYFFGIELAEVYLIYLQLRKCYTIDILIDVFDSTTDGLMCVFSRPYCSLHGSISSESNSRGYALYICSYVSFIYHIYISINRFDSTTDNLMFLSSTAILFAI